MEDPKPDPTDPASGAETPSPVNEITEDDLEQVSGGSKNTVREIANELSLNKMKNAQKNIDKIKGYL